MKPFREWLAELWRKNCDEHDAYREPRYTMQEYFSQYKYWLKREYRHQCANFNNRETEHGS